jgi:hypothetical protein
VFCFPSLPLVFFVLVLAAFLRFHAGFFTRPRGCAGVRSWLGHLAVFRRSLIGLSTLGRCTIRSGRRIPDGDSRLRRAEPASAHWVRSREPGSTLRGGSGTAGVGRLGWDL